MEGARKKKRWMIIGIALLAIIVVAGSGVGYWYVSTRSSPVVEKTFKVALVVEGQNLDKSFNEYMYDAMLQIQKLPGFTVSFSEQVTVPDFPRVASLYASEGYDMIYCHTTDFLQSALTTAPKYNGTWFIVNRGYTFGPSNLASLTCSDQDGFYLEGIMAAKMTKTNKIGLVYGFKYENQLVSMNGFISGVWSVNKNITILNTATQSWNDVGLAYEASKGLTEQGCDFLVPFGSAQALGTIQAAKEMNVSTFGYYEDLNYLAPNNVVTSVLVTPYTELMVMINLIKQGQLEPKAYIVGLANNATGLAPYYQGVPSNVTSAVAVAESNIRLGSVRVPYIPNTLLTG